MPRERSIEAGEYETAADIAAWWDENRDKRWNPEIGPYVHEIEPPESSNNSPPMDLAAMPLKEKVTVSAVVMPLSFGPAVPSCQGVAATI